MNLNSFLKKASAVQKITIRHEKSDSKPNAQASTAPKATTEKIGIAQSKKKINPLRREGSSSVVGETNNSEDFELSPSGIFSILSIFLYFGARDQYSSFANESKANHCTSHFTKMILQGERLQHRFACWRTSRPRSDQSN